MSINVKQQLLDALNESDFGEGIKNFLLTALPADPGVPASVDAAIIANGHLSNYLIAILNSFTGLTPIDLLLHAGQKNATLQGILLSSLELAKAARDFSFEIYSPNPNQEFQEGDDVPISVGMHSREPVSEVICTLEKDGEPFRRVTLEYQDDLRYSVTLPDLEPDPYHADITVTWLENNYMKLESVDFFVMES